MQKPILQLNNVSIAYSEELYILKSLNFSLNIGEIICLVGKSGSGKTTLLNVISNILKPQNGSVLLRSNTIVSYLMQTLVLMNYRTAIENAVLALELRENLNERSFHRVANMFKAFDLEYAKEKFPFQLSGGMKQRIGLIQTLCIEANLYLLDEPFTAIDRRTSPIIEEYIWNLFRKNNASSIIVTHDFEQALSMADKISILSEYGEIHSELIFEKEFSQLSPTERKKSQMFQKYLFQLVKNFSES